MHILLVADGRSPITRRWVQAARALQHRVSLVSTYPCADVEGVEQIMVLPVAFGGMAGSQVGKAGRPPGANGADHRRNLLRRFRSLFVSTRYLIGPLTLGYYGARFRRLVRQLQPDLVHALRIPFEGMLAAYTPPGVPLVVSIWGNDLTLHAQRSGWMSRLTRRALQRADGLVADAQRDIRLGREWGFALDRPSLVVPGSGGIDLGQLQAARGHSQELLAHLPPDAPLVINPRGFRPGSVRTEVFFQSIPYVLQHRPEVHFLCAGMAGQSEAEQWLEKLRVQERVHLLPYLSQPELWDIFLRADVTVSVSAHDGTPNSLLEAMGCGCFPVAGDIESLREWVTPGVNGLLVDPEQPQALAEAVLIALDRPELRAAAAEKNRRIVSERAESSMVRAQIEVFYQRLAGVLPGITDLNAH
jgi:glycosyltransferase involved in cell wall biosynthesis